MKRWPSLAAYVVSFTVIGIMWVNHHTIFTHLRVVNRGMFYFNLLLLMTIVFIPYPTEVFGEALSRSQGATTAAVFYSATMTINALAWASLWLYASVGRRLLSWEFPEPQRRVSTILFISTEPRSMRFRSASHSSVLTSAWRSMVVSRSITPSTRSHGESLSKATLEVPRRMDDVAAVLHSSLAAIFDLDAAGRRRRQFGSKTG